MLRFRRFAGVFFFISFVDFVYSFLYQKYSFLLFNQ